MSSNGQYDEHHSNDAENKYLNDLLGRNNGAEQVNQGTDEDMFRLYDLIVLTDGVPF